MKITLDLTKLREEGKITDAEFEKLSQLAAEGTGSLAFNILIGFGVIAVSCGLLALAPNAATSVVVGLVVGGGGLALYNARWKQWQILAHICVLVGALLLGGGMVILGKASVTTFLAIAIGFALAGVIARSGLLIVGSVLALSSSLGSRTDYMHASYFLGIQEPTATIVVFSLLGVAAYQLSKRLGSDYERLAITAARTSVFLVNLGFWVGSLWGDGYQQLKIAIGDWVFAVLWAVALVGTGIWAARANRRWVVNVVAVFAAIHFYTQYFERLGAQPATILIAGLIALGFAAALWNFNRRLWGRTTALK